MSITDGRTEETDRLAEYPDFEISYLFDDGDCPGAVTLYDPEAPDSGWISADISGVVPVEETR